jgi:hypothetical protein
MSYNTRPLLPVESLWRPSYDQLSSSASSNFLLCNISQIAMGVPYSESPWTTFESGTILIKIRCNLICFRAVQRFDVWVGVHSWQCPQKLHSPCTVLVTLIHAGHVNIPEIVWLHDFTLIVLLWNSNARQWIHFETSVCQVLISLSELRFEYCWTS